MKILITLRTAVALWSLHAFQTSDYNNQQQPSTPSPAEFLYKTDGLRLHDTQTGMLLGIPRSARCVQRFDDSLNSAIHITYRISLRSSSLREPRDPLLKVVFSMLLTITFYIDWVSIESWQVTPYAIAYRVVHRGIKSESVNSQMGTSEL